MQASLLTVDSPCWAGNCLKPNMEKVRIGRLAGRGAGAVAGTGTSLVGATPEHCSVLSTGLPLVARPLLTWSLTWRRGFYVRLIAWHPQTLSRSGQVSCPELEILILITPGWSEHLLLIQTPDQSVLVGICNQLVYVDGYSILYIQYWPWLVNL